MSSTAIKAYAELCFLANRETDQVEFLAMAMFGIIPDWVKELSE